MHLTDGRGGDRHRAPVEEELLGVGAELVAQNPLGQARCHRRDVGLQRGQRGLGLRGQTLGDERDHLAGLHDGALHVAEHLGHVFGGANDELLLEAGALFVGRPPSAQLHRGPVRAAPGGQPPHARLSLEPAAAVVIAERGADTRRRRASRTRCRRRSSCAPSVGRYPVGRGALPSAAAWSSTQNRAAGIASRRASPMGRPQASHNP